MISTFHGIEVGKRGLQVHQQGLHVIEHNVSNSNTEGYSRQRLTIKTFDPLYVPGLTREERPGQVGMGPIENRIGRIRNAFLDDRIMSEKSNEGYWNTMHFNMYQIEQFHNESSQHTIRNYLDQYWKSWEKLNKNPTDRATRSVVRETALTLSRGVSKTFDRLFNLQSNIDTQIRLKVSEINSYAKQISQLNEQILKSEQVGDSPNDLMDKRDLMVEKLSKMINLNVVRTDRDEFMINIGSQYLVQGQKFRKLLAEGNASNDGYADVKWGDDKSKVKLLTGELKALVKVRDDVLGNQIKQIDNLSANLIDLVNEVHKDGFGLNFKTNMRFFKKINLTQNRNGNYDFSGDGQEDKTILFKMSGTKKIDPDLEVGSAGVLNFGPIVDGGKDVTISYTARDKIKEVIDRINRSEVGVVAYLNHRGRMSIKASLPKEKKFMKFVIRHIEDSGDLLVGISGLLRNRGAQGAYDWNSINQVNKLVGGEKDYSVSHQHHPSRWIGLDDAIKRDVNNISASQGVDTTGDDRFNKSNGIGDGNNALKLAKIRYSHAMIGENSTFDEYFTALIGQLGSDSRDSKIHLEKSQLVLKHLQNNRKSISGVSIDEEMANMIMFQHGYNASARVISTLDSMLDTIINRMRA